MSSIAEADALGRPDLSTNCWANTATYFADPHAPWQRPQLEPQRTGSPMLSTPVLPLKVCLLRLGTERFLCPLPDFRNAALGVACGALLRKSPALVGALAQRIDPAVRGHAVLDHARQAVEGVVAEGGGTA